MKENRKWNRLFGMMVGFWAVFAVMLLLPVRARALTPAEDVKGTKTAVAVDEKERTYRLEYKVWSGETVNRSVMPCDVIFLLDRTAASDPIPVREGVCGFLRELGGAAPGSRAALVGFGENPVDVGPVSLGEEELAGLEKELAGWQFDSREADYTAGLQQAGKLLENWPERGDRPLYLITLASGTWAGTCEGTDSTLAALHRLREQGARAYTVLLRTDPEEEIGEFWETMSSAPVASHHFLCGGDPASCLTLIRRDIASAFDVEVRQLVDPRFSLDREEQDSLRKEGAHISMEEDGSYSLSWTVTLPRSADRPWTASLTLRAREDFPGGNDVPTDREGTGLYRSGRSVGELPETTVNVDWSLTLEGVEDRIFLGEKVPVELGGKSVEELMRTSPAVNWYGKGRTVSFTYLWETLAGQSVGSLEQLAELRPKTNTTYRFQVTCQPESSGRTSAGTPVRSKTFSALYRVRVASGTVRIIAEPERDGLLDRTSGMLFRLEGPEGLVRFLAAVPEEDPESGRFTLQAEFTGLPRGKYTVTPVSEDSLRCRESFRSCRLGPEVGKEQSTLRFTLGKGRSRAG